MMIVSGTNGFSLANFDEVVLGVACADVTLRRQSPNRLVQTADFSVFFRLHEGALAASMAAAIPRRQAAGDINRGSSGLAIR
jgi:hypothetical protein